MKLYESIEPDIQEWIMAQQVFFSASAPYAGKHINVSPKGLPATSFCVLNPNQCAYVDATGSGVETIANIYQNGRVTIMFCSFAKSPRILRLFCTGRVIEWDQPEFQPMLAKMGDLKFTGMRAIIMLDVFKVQSSCGFGVPFLATKPDPADVTRQVPYLEDRQTLGHWAGKVIDQNKMDNYRAENNQKSLDGLPGLRRARRDNGEVLWMTDIKTRSTHGSMAIIFTAVCSMLFTLVGMYALGLTTVPIRA